MERGTTAPVDSVSGHLEFRLPIEPPVRTDHVANPPSLSFVPDSLVPGFDTIAARSTRATKPQTIATQVAVPDLTFTFP